MKKIGKSMMHQKKQEIPALYIHIPFCKKVCPFCSFAVMKENSKLHTSYIDLLQLEIQLLKENNIIGDDDPVLESIYLGGGTPSILSEGELWRIVEMIQKEFYVKAGCQFSIEMNPEDVTSEKLRTYREMGINRISLGVQSFNDENLHRMGRNHTRQQALDAVDIIKKEAVLDFNLDLMFGALGQTLPQLKQDLEQFIKMKPTHISPYCLNIEPKTALNRKPDWIQWQISNEELLLQMFQMISEVLEAQQYEQYEVSNFSKEGYRSRQNQLNWEGKNYLGVGAGAHSYIYPSRWGNEKRYLDYKKAVLSGQLPQAFNEKLVEGEILDEYIMIRLRLKEGLNLKKVEQLLGAGVKSVWENKIKQYVSLGVASYKDETLSLTPKGLFLADEIAAELAAAI